ncbi:GtrA family protein [Hyphomonas sp.]|uniref:GtrA family protein n=1 Tax=Hyphomonas sp. TaxID=87 RepID=UPI0032D8F243
MRAVRFFFVGLIGTGAYVLIGYSLIWSGMPVLMAHVIATALSLLVSYSAQKTITFRVNGMHRRMGPRFVIATAALVLTQLALVACLKHFHVQSELILAASTLFYPPASFLVHNFWTFKTGNAADQTSASA